MRSNVTLNQRAILIVRTKIDSWTDEETVLASLVRHDFLFELRYDIGLKRLLGETLTGYSGTKYHRNLTNKHTKKRYIRAINNLRILIKSPRPE